MIKLRSIERRTLGIWKKKKIVQWKYWSFFFFLSSNKSLIYVRIERQRENDRTPQFFHSRQSEILAWNNKNPSYVAAVIWNSFCRRTRFRVIRTTNSVIIEINNFKTNSSVTSDKSFEPVIVRKQRYFNKLLYKMIWSVRIKVDATSL